MRLANSGPWTLRELDLAVLPQGKKPIRVLHISDIHFAPGQRKKAKFLRDLAELSPDLVINTGDNLGHRGAINAVLNALGPLSKFPGVFVNGSNDYRHPSFRNPVKYIFKPSEPDGFRDIDTERFTRELENHGWLNLNNQSGKLEVNGTKLGFFGLDDPHEHLENLPGLQSQKLELKNVDFRIGVAHAPYMRVIEGLTAAGSEVIFCGHTHGGQICLPGERALTTNCDLPTKYAKGVSAWEHAGNKSLLHVSAGIGASIFAPVRIFCPPEASLITLKAS